jgi:hypothetical protein
MDHTDRVKEFARYYAGRGWHVLPLAGIDDDKCSCGDSDCSSPGKHPLTGNGFKGASTHTEDVNRWWERNTTANLGIRTGTCSGLVVIDIDDDKDGENCWEDLCEGHDPVETVEVLTGRGRHLYFKHPGDRIVRSTIGLRSGVDIRADDAYVVAPPSRHVSGRDYTFEDTSRPDETEMAPVPDWLLSEMDCSRDSIELRSIADPIPDIITDGHRHQHLLSLAGSMRNRGAVEEEIFQSLVAINTSRCDPPLEENEVRRLSRDVATRYTPSNKPLVLSNEKTPYKEVVPGLLPFPLEVLPTPLLKFVQEASASLPAPPDLVAVPLLSVLATGIGSSRTIELKPNWQESATIWTAIVAKPGMKKSPAMDLVMTPMKQAQSWLKADYENAVVNFDNEMARYLAEKNSEKPIEPRMKQLFTTDATLEAMAELLEHNPRGLLFMRDELSGWVRGMDQYRGGRGADRQTWLSFWARSQTIVNRKSRRTPLVLGNPFVCVTGGIPPDILGELADEGGRDDGFVHRILFSYPEEVTSHWTDDEITSETMNGYCDVFTGLRELPESPQVVYFTMEGRKAFIDWMDDHHLKLSEVPEVHRGPYEKLIGYCSRIALILQMSRYVCGEADSENVDEASVYGATAIIEYFKSHMQRVYGRLYTNKLDRQVLSSMEWVGKRGDSASVRDFITYKVGGCQNRADVEQLFQELVRRGHGEIAETESGNGRSSLAFSMYKDSAVCLGT